jgi:hypothetical protein
MVDLSYWKNNIKVTVKGFIRKILNTFFVKVFLRMPMVEICAFWPSFLLIKAMRLISQIQLSPKELKTIIITIMKKRPCNFLVFGLGNDSVYWSRLNFGGRTVFIEDSTDWFQQVKKQNPHINAYLVQYKTSINQWEKLLESPSIFDLDLPKEVTQV